MAVESSKGECNDGQHEINFHYGPALRTADEHSIYKTGREGDRRRRRAWRSRSWPSTTQREGSSCHIHLSLRRDGRAAFASDEAAFERFVAGQLACLRELTLFYAPNINSYKRFAKGSFAPTAVAWGRDNRTCAVRVVGHGDALRVELRVPGADVNPYLALAAMIAAGLHGLDAELELGAAAGRQRLRVRQAARADDAGRGARAVRGQPTSRAAPSARRSSTHYLNDARVELDAFEAFVTDWERARGFERL